MQEPQARGTSLWLMPGGEARARLAGLIEDLATRLGTSPFAPHVTLLPGLTGPEDEVIDRGRILAAELAPLSLELCGIDGLDTPFRCLFGRVAASQALGEAHGRAARRFGRDPDPAFDPHLSLVYGALDGPVKEALKGELTPTAPRCFEARHLHVWRTEGRVGDWRELAVHPLRGRRSPEEPR